MAAFTVSGITGGTANVAGGSLPRTGGSTAYKIGGVASGSALLTPQFATKLAAKVLGSITPAGSVLPATGKPSHYAGGTGLIAPVRTMPGTVKAAVSFKGGDHLLLPKMVADFPGGYLTLHVGTAGSSSIFGVTGGRAVMTGNLILGFKVTGSVIPASAMGFPYHFRDTQGGTNGVIARPVTLTGTLDIQGVRSSPPMVILDGTNFLERPGDDAVLDGSATFSVSVTFDPELIVPGQDCTIASKNDESGTDWGWKITYAASTGIVTAKVFEDTLGVSLVQRSTSTAVRKRSRITFVYNAGALTIYKDGVQDQGAETKVGIATAPNNSTEPFALGCNTPTANPTTGLFKGAIYDFALWNTNLPSATAAKLKPDGSIPTEQAANLQVWFSSARITATGVNPKLLSWIDVQASLALQTGDPAGFNPVYVLALGAGLPGGPPLPLTHDWGVTLQDSATTITPNQTLSALYAFDSTFKWRLWSAGALSPIIPSTFRSYRGDLTCLMIVHRPKGTIQATVLRIYGLRIENEVLASPTRSRLFVISGDDNVGSTNRRIDYPIGLPDGRDLAGSAPLTIVGAAVKILVLIYNSFDNEVSVIDAGFGRVTPSSDIATTANERLTTFEVAGLVDFQRCMLIPAALSEAQIQALLLGFQPSVYNTRIQSAPQWSPFQPNPVTRHFDQREPPLHDVVKNETIPPATSGTVASGKLVYAGPPGAIRSSSVTVRIPGNGSPTQLLAYVDNGFGLFVASGGSPAPTSSFVRYQGAAATGTITIAAGNPSNGDTVTLTDYLGTVQVFVFVTGAAPQTSVVGIPVTIGVDNTTTGVNLRDAINGARNYLKIAATAASGVVTVTQRNVGTPGNTTITKSGANITVSGFTGGQTPGDWSITIAAGSPQFDPARFDGTADYTWDSQGAAFSAATVAFDDVTILTNNLYSTTPGLASKYHPYTDSPFQIRDGGQAVTGGSGSSVFLDPKPIVVTVTADAAKQITAVVNAGPTDAGNLITWWEVELVSGSTEVVVVADYLKPNVFATNRNHTDTFPIPTGQNFDNKRIRFVILSLTDASQRWESLYFRMLGTNFNNAPATIITNTVVQTGPTVAGTSLLVSTAKATLSIPKGKAAPAKLRQVDSNSRYKLTPLFTSARTGKRGLEYGLLTTLSDFTKTGRSFRIHRVRTAEIGFLDRIAVDFYGAGFEWAWWVLAYTNGITDPEVDMREGMELVIPDRSAIQSFLSRKPATFVDPAGL